jgi:hypothetical protein
MTIGGVSRYRLVGPHGCPYGFLLIPAGFADKMQGKPLAITPISNSVLTEDVYPFTQPALLKWLDLRPRSIDRDGRHEHPA